MKIFITLFALMLSFNSFAGEPTQNNSWDEIQKAVKADWDLSFSHYVVFVGRPVSSFDVCIEDDHFNTTRKFPIYKRVRVPRSRDNQDGDRDGWASKKVGEEILSYPLVYTSYRNKCNNRGNNCKRVAYTEVQDTVKNVKIMKRTRRRGGDRDDKYKELFTKTYHIPTCK